MTIVEGALVTEPAGFEWLYWFWYHPGTKQLVHVEGTHTTSAVWDLGFWPEGRDPAEKDDLDLEDDDILALAINAGWVRGRYGKQVPSEFSDGTTWKHSDEVEGGERELSLQGLPRNVARTAAEIARKGVHFDVLYVDFGTAHNMEGHRLAGTRLEMFLKTGRIPSKMVSEKTAPSR